MPVSPRYLHNTTHADAVLRATVKRVRSSSPHLFATGPWRDEERRDGSVARVRTPARASDPFAEPAWRRKSP